MPTFIPHLLDEDISAHEKRRLGVKTLFTAGKSLVHLFLGIFYRVLHRSLVAIDPAVWLPDMMHSTLLHYIECHNSLGHVPCCLQQQYHKYTLKT